MAQIDFRQEHEQKKSRLLHRLKAESGTPVGLNKSTSNLFRHRSESGAKKIDLSGFNQVVFLDGNAGIAEVEGMATYESIVDVLLLRGYMPAVVPELKTITIGGAVTGIGIESSSFKFGFVHETVLEMDILTGAREILHCRPDNEHKALFFGFPNSYGTLGYAVKLAIRVIPIKDHVLVTHKRFHATKEYLEAIAAACGEKNGPDFIDGTIFSPREMYITRGRFIAGSPKASDYTYMNIYYQSIRQRTEDVLTLHDYIWRWDTDWFWCSKHFLAQNPLVRRLYGRRRLRSTTYWNIRSWCSRKGITARLDRLRRQQREAVIQDVEIPIRNCENFLRFFQQEIKITPVWVCPVKQADPSAEYPLYHTDPHSLYLNFGFWDTVPTNKPAGHFNLLIEKKVEELGGKKSLYSDSYYSRDKFWQLYDRKAYQALKIKYDPEQRFPDLYDKCVKAQFR